MPATKKPVIDLSLIRSASERLDRAKEIDPSVTERPVPVETILESKHLTLTVPELAELARMHPLTIRRAIHAGELKAAHGGGRSPYFISKLDANDWWRSRGGGLLFPVVDNVQQA